MDGTTQRGRVWAQEEGPLRAEEELGLGQPGLMSPDHGRIVAGPVGT